METVCIVMAWLSDDIEVVSPGQPDIGRPAKLKAIKVPKAVVWLNEGTPTDVAKAIEYAQTDGRTVLCYPAGIDNPLETARKDIMKGITNE